MVFLADYLSDIRESNARIQHHLSNRSQNRFLQDFSEEVLKTILNNVRIAQYYSLQMDCTPDVSHKEQTSIILRHIHIYKNSSEVKILEKFVGFLKL
jgi:hypothetical protein